MTANILIVDDVEANLYTLEALLLEIDDKRFKNLNIIQSLSGEEALKIVISQPVDLIILDIQMPVMNGFEVAKFLGLNKKTKNIPIVFLTAAFKSDEFVDKGYNLGAIDYFTKPIKQDIFVNKIRLYLALIIKSKHLEVLEASRVAQMREMFTMIAHQWRQPLSSIATTIANLNTMQMMELEIEDKFLSGELNILSDRTQQLSHTIDDFRQFFKDDQAKAVTTLQRIIKGVLNILKPTLKSSHITIIEEYNTDKELTIFTSEINKAILNILKNSQEQLTSNNIQNPTISIIADFNEESGKYIITIKDNAGGIPEDIIKEVTQPYFTTHKDSKNRGIGLYISELIVEETCKGKLNISNNSEGAVVEMVLNRS